MCSSSSSVSPLSSLAGLLQGFDAVLDQPEDAQSRSMVILAVQAQRFAMLYVSRAVIPLQLSASRINL